MYIRQLLAFAALLFIGANSLPQPQSDPMPTATEASTGDPSIFPMMGGEHKAEHMEYAGDHHAFHKPGGFGPSSSGAVPVQTPTTTTDDTTDDNTGGAAASSVGSYAASSTAAAATAASTVTSGKLRLVRAF